MNSAAWLAANNRYLAASLHWLHVRLKQRLPPVAALGASTAPNRAPFAAPVAAPVSRLMTSSAVLSLAVPGLAQARSWFSQRAPDSVAGLATAAALAPPTSTTPATSDRSDMADRADRAAPAAPPTVLGSDASRQAGAARDAAAQIDPPPALLVLAARFGLSSFERDVLLLCVAAELDAEIGALFAAVQGGAANIHPTFGLAFYVLDEPAWDALAPSRPLRGMRLVDIHQPAASPLTACALRADERIVNYIKGLNVLDERLARLLAPVLETPVLATSQQAPVEEILLHVRRAIADAALAAGDGPGRVTRDLAGDVAGDIAGDIAADSSADRDTRAARASALKRAGPTAHAQPCQPSEPNPGPPAPPLASRHPPDLPAPPQRAGAPALLSLPAFQLVGADITCKLAVASAVSASVSRPLYRLGADALPTSRPEGENLARLWQREMALLPLALYVDMQALDRGDGNPDAQAALAWFLAHPLGLVFVGARHAAVASAACHVVEVHRPTAVEQCAAWRTALPAHWSDEATEDSARRLAGQFDLSLNDIQQAAQGNEQPPRTATLSEVWDASRRLTRSRLDVLAQRLDPRATWEDLVLCGESLDLLHQITTQLRNRYQVYEDWGFAARSRRGLGISALFTGESGTGKTMAAEVLANSLQLNLYRVDLSALVGQYIGKPIGRYIGEIEKNLLRLFDAAEQGGAILYFDEADALFGARVDGPDGHDRYASPGINFLLQRMESFSGLAILATPQKSALDPGFQRRLRFAVHFPFPGLAEREAMWRKAWPAEVPCEGLDFERLARASVCGGAIQSVAMNAAFAAAQRGTPVTMSLLMAALRTELRKLGQPLDEAELR